MSRTTAILSVALTALLFACTPDFDDARDVKDLRILGMRAEPPELLFDSFPQTIPPVSIEALIADPRDPTRAVAWELWACSPEALYCGEASYAERVHGDTTLLDAVRVDFTPSPTLFAAALDNDSFRGFGGLPIMLELRLQDGFETLRAVKRVGYTFPLPYSPLPPEKVANENPSTLSVDINGTLLQPGETLQVRVEQEIEILPRSSVGSPCVDEPLSADCYWVTSAQLPSGGGLPTGIEFLQVPEFFTYRFFTSAGKLSHGQTGGPPSPFFDNKKIEDVSVEWTAPTDSAEASVWIVVDDGRGGVTWRRIDITIDGAVQPPPS